MYEVFLNGNFPRRGKRCGVESGGSVCVKSSIFFNSPVHQFTTSPVSFCHITTSPVSFCHLTTSPLHQFTSSPLHQFGCGFGCGGSVGVEFSPKPYWFDGFILLFHQLLYCFKDKTEFFIIFSLQIFNFFCQFFIAFKKFAKLDRKSVV